MINAAEAGGSVAITGTVGGDAQVGDTVTLTVNGVNYTGTVAAGQYLLDQRARRRRWSADGSRPSRRSVSIDRRGRQRGQRCDAEGYTVDMRAPAPTMALTAT